MTTPDDLVARLKFAANQDSFNGYTLKMEAVGRITELELRRDVISDVQNKQLRHAEADNAKLREALRELVEIKDLCVETGGVEMGREFRAWDAARAALEQP